MRFGRRKIEGDRPWRISAKLLIVSSVITVIGFSAICANVMLNMRRGEEFSARQSLENLASGIDADISRNIEVYDLSLRAVASNMVMPEIKDVSKSIRHLILFDHAATARHFGAIEVFDATGKLTVDASTLDPLPENWGEGQELIVEGFGPSDDPAEILKWYEDLVRLSKDIPTDDHARMAAAIAEQDREAKEWMRRHMGLK